EVPVDGGAPELRAGRHPLDAERRPADLLGDGPGAVEDVLPPAFALALTALVDAHDVEHDGPPGSTGTSRDEGPGGGGSVPAGPPKEEGHGQAAAFVQMVRPLSGQQRGMLLPFPHSQQALARM